MLDMLDVLTKCFPDLACDRSDSSCGEQEGDYHRSDTEEKLPSQRHGEVIIYSSC